MIRKHIEELISRNTEHNVSTYEPILNAGVIYVQVREAMITVTDDKINFKDVKVRLALKDRIERPMMGVLTKIMVNIHKAQTNDTQVKIDKVVETETYTYNENLVTCYLDCTFSGWVDNDKILAKLKAATVQTIGVK